MLRIYRDTLTASMKTTIKNAVAELLPAFSAQSLESERTSAERTADTDGEYKLQDFFKFFRAH